MTNTPTKLPSNPKASGEYSRVIIGEANKVISCAPAVPPITTKTLRTSLLCDRYLIKIGKVILNSYLII
jgi:hypothetical protein